MPASAIVIDERAGAVLDPRGFRQPGDTRRPDEREAEAEDDPADDQRDVAVGQHALRDAGDAADDRRRHCQPGCTEAIRGQTGRQRDRHDRERRGGEQDARAGRVEAERLLEIGRERHELLPGDLPDQDQGVEGEKRAAHARTVERPRAPQRVQRCVNVT